MWRQYNYHSLIFGIWYVKKKVFLCWQKKFVNTFKNFDFLRSVRSHRKTEIFDFVKISPTSKLHKLKYGTFAISVPLGIPDI
jgi:hypothetical protein